ncbi:hypothetical protein QLX67_03835 [Balneolaceae bacterium ANBcel3]|nr:hypothetical protein [Balneolaceae bacterium ANBcel3]
MYDDRRKRRLSYLGIGFVMVWMVLSSSSWAGAQELENEWVLRYEMEEAGKSYSAPFEISENRTPNPWGAFFRSLAVPGWGHHYIDSDHWRAGQFHLAADVVILAAWFGVNRQAYVVDKNMYSFGRQHSGVDLKQHDRAYELAVGRHRSYDDYIDFLERTRNWDVLEEFPDAVDSQWEWESEEARREYIRMRDRRDDLEKQLPTLAAMLVVNRLASAVGSFSRARSYGQRASLSVEPGPDFNGAQARLTVSF